MPTSHLRGASPSPPPFLRTDGDIASIWDIPDVLEMLDRRLVADDAALLETIVETLDDTVNRALLEGFELWRSVPEG